MGWNMPFLFSMAFIQSFVAMISSVNLLYILLHSWDQGSMMRQLGLGGISYGAFAVTCSTCFAMFWPKSYPDGIQTEGLVQSPPYMLEVFVWSWSLIWWFVEDAAKVFCRWIVHK